MMNDLSLFLKKRQKSVDWEKVRRVTQTKSEQIEGQEVFNFRFNLDQKLDQVNDSLNISQQPYSSFVPWHYHDYLEIMYVFKGNCRVFLMGAEVENLELKEGNILILDKKTIHRLEEIKQGNIILNLVIKKDYLTKHLLGRLSQKGLMTNFMVQSINKQKFEKKYLLFRTADKDEPIGLVNKIVNEYYERGPFSEEVIDSLMILFFIELIRGNYLENAIEEEGNDRVSTVHFLNYIEENYREDSLQKMADHFNYHPNYLSNRLKKETGKSYKELVHIQKMTMASILLTSTELPIEKIVDYIGYSSVGFFYKKFKEFYHKTPVKFRENL